MHLKALEQVMIFQAVEHAMALKAVHHVMILQAIIEAHDDVAAKNYEVMPEDFPLFAPTPQTVYSEQPTTDAIKMVGIRKNANEPLVNKDVYCYISYVSVFIY